MVRPLSAREFRARQLLSFPIQHGLRLACGISQATRPRFLAGKIADQVLAHFDLGIRNAVGEGVARDGIIGIVHRIRYVVSRGNVALVGTR